MFHIDWTPIILKMFSGKIDQLFINNVHFPAYISKRSTDILKEARHYQYQIFEFMFFLGIAQNGETSMAKDVLPELSERNTVHIK